MIDGLDYLAALAVELIATDRRDHDPGDEDVPPVRAETSSRGATFEVRR